MSARDRRLRKKIYKRDNGKCAYCGKHLSFEESTLDHIVPKSLGGKLRAQKNVVLSCWDCNEKKADNDIRLFCMLLRTIKNKQIKKALGSNRVFKSLYKKGCQPI